MNETTASDIRVDPKSFLQFLLRRHSIQDLCKTVDERFKDWFRREGIRALPRR